MQEDLLQLLEEGDMHVMKGNPAIAMEYYVRALAIEPGSALAGYSKAYALYSMENYTGAADSCRETLSLNPENADLWELLGKMQIRLEKLDEALNSYKNAANYAEGGVPSRKVRMIFEWLEELCK